MYTKAYLIQPCCSVESTDAVKRLPAPAPVDSIDIETRSQQTGSSLLSHEYL